MIRLTVRQFRGQAIVAAVLLAVVAALLASTGPYLARLYDDFAAAQAKCTTGRCFQQTIDVGEFNRLLELFGTVLVAVPGLIGAFWGAPLVARELEQGTHRLAWTQSVTRTRWLAVKLALIGAASVVATGLLSLMVTWWSSPIDRADLNRFSAGMFGERNIAPLGYAAFGFTLGVAVGLVLRRSIAAMAATLGVFLGVRLLFTYIIRPHLLSPVRRNLSLDAVVHGFGSSNNGPNTLFASANIPGAWIYSTRIVDASGRQLSPQTVSTTCPDLFDQAPPPSGGSGSVSAQVPSRDPLTACIDKLRPAYHGLVTYQPANRYWTLQLIETGIFLAVALALAGFCFYWIRRRIS